MGSVLALISGALFGFSLIVAIGPQNQFVLRQGIAKRHVGAIVAVCFFSDALLIAIGTGGMGGVLKARPELYELIRFGGATFLGVYSMAAMRRALRHRHSLVLGPAQAPSLTKSISYCLALTWLNPHVYIDTVVLVGAVADSKGASAPLFAIGAMTASLVWFAALGYGARMLRPLLVRPVAVLVLDLSIAAVMLCIGLSLVTQGVKT